MHNAKQPQKKTINKTSASHMLSSTKLAATSHGHNNNSTRKINNSSTTTSAAAASQSMVVEEEPSILELEQFEIFKLSKGCSLASGGNDNNDDDHDDDENTFIVEQCVPIEDIISLIAQDAKSVHIRGEIMSTGQSIQMQITTWQINYDIPCVECVCNYIGNLRVGRVMKQQHQQYILQLKTPSKRFMRYFEKTETRMLLCYRIYELLDENPNMEFNTLIMIVRV